MLNVVQETQVIPHQVRDFQMTALLNRGIRILQLELVPLVVSCILKTAPQQTFSLLNNPNMDRISLRRTMKIMKIDVAIS